jgi:tRNA-intron lyase
MAELPTFVIVGSCLRHHGDFAEAVQVYDQGMFGKCPSTRSRPKPEIPAASNKRRCLEGDDEHAQQERGKLHVAPEHGWLQLTLMEGFYLAFVCKRIRIVCREGDVENEMDEQAAWRAFCAKASTFPQRYAAYRHYREQDWVPTGGIKYGIDHLLYKSDSVADVATGRHQHAPFSALILHEGKDNMTWRDLQSASRVACQVSKQLLVTVVEGKCDATRGHEDVKNLRVTEFVLDRWEPEREKESQMKKGKANP